MGCGGNWSRTFCWAGGCFLAIATFGAGVPIAVVGFAGAVASVGVLIAVEVQI